MTVTNSPDHGLTCDHIRLKEHTSELVPDLGDDDLQFLISRYPQAISVTIDPHWRTPRLAASSWIGVITLPSGRELRIDTKVPVANVFYMLGFVSGWGDYFRLDDVAGYAADATILDVVARFFVDQCLVIEGRGLYRAYAEQNDNVAAVRGRIDFQSDVRENLVERQRTACSFSEFTRDLPENQVLRQTASLLAGCRLVDTLALDLRRLDYWWSDVSLSRHEPARALGFAYHRLNQHYQPAHELAALLLQWLSPGGSEGDRPFPAFLANMNDLYEKFVLCILSGALREYVQLSKPRRLPLDTERRVHFQPDLLFTEHTRPVLVGDCKYKRIGPDIWTDNDIYQMVAYCTALGLDTGLLIFPRHLVDADDELIIQGAGIRVKRLTMDLGVPVTEMPRECARLVERILLLLRAGGGSSTSFHPRSA